MVSYACACISPLSEHNAYPSMAMDKLNPIQLAAQRQFDRQRERYGKGHVLSDISDVRDALGRLTWLKPGRCGSGRHGCRAARLCSRTCRGPWAPACGRQAARPRSAPLIRGITTSVSSSSMRRPDAAWPEPQAAGPSAPREHGVALRRAERPSRDASARLLVLDHQDRLAAAPRARLDRSGGRLGPTPAAGADRS